MKIRQGFVSNSSSSSFIVIERSKHSIPKVEDQELVVPYTFGGETEFGWTPHDYTDFGSKLNFAYLRILYVEDQELKRKWKDMLTTLLIEKLKVSTVKYLLNTDFDSNDSGYIDHQSCEGDRDNTDMFDSIGALEDYLFCNKSYVHTDNDNH